MFIKSIQVSTYQDTHFESFQNTYLNHQLKKKHLSVNTNTLKKHIFTNIFFNFINKTNMNLKFLLIF